MVPLKLRGYAIAWRGTDGRLYDSEGSGSTEEENFDRDPPVQGHHGIRVN
jgi:hypothetical protein